MFISGGVEPATGELSSPSLQAELSFHFDGVVLAFLQGFPPLLPAHVLPDEGVDVGRREEREAGQGVMGLVLEVMMHCNPSLEFERV